MKQSGFWGCMVNPGVAGCFQHEGLRSQMWTSSAAKAACCQASWPEFNVHKSHSVSLTSTQERQMAATLWLTGCCFYLGIRSEQWKTGQSLGVFPSLSEQLRAFIAQSDAHSLLSYPPVLGHFLDFPKNLLLQVTLKWEIHPSICVPAFWS